MSFSSLFTSLTGMGFFYEKNPRHATYNFSQDGRSLYRNQPRFPFEYYIDIKLNNVGTASTYIKKYFSTADLQQIMPLVKTIDMPSMKIETTALNQYNRKRLSQTKIAFEPVKVVFHDVADGKTLKFWDMYYKYYFSDGSEPGVNDVKQAQAQNKSMSVESLIKGIIPKINPAITSLPASIKSLINGNSLDPSASLATNTNGDKKMLQNIVGNSLDNHNFGFNLPTVDNIRNLIQTIDIYQVHGGRFNKVTLVNPRISAFTHDVLNYAAGDKTLELTMTFEYEYAYYTIQNLELGGSESNNQSTKDQFSHGEALELPSLAFNAKLMDFIESNNPLLQSDNPILQRIGKNVQSSIGDVTGKFAGNLVRKTSSSVLNGLASISPKPASSPQSPLIQTRPFASSAATNPGNNYADMSRIAKGAKSG